METINKSMKYDNNMNVFQMLRVVRNLSVEDVAKKLSVSTDYVYSVERGEVFPPDNMLTDYANILDVKKHVLTTFDPEDKNNKAFKNVILHLLWAFVSIKDEDA